MVAATAAADPAEESTDRLVGIGYKAGNGVGFLGADVVVDPIPHLGVEVQGAVFPVSVNNETSNGWAIATELRSYLAAHGSTPYASIGVVYAHLELGTASASATGTFANLGYEWRWRMGLRVHVGGGVGYLTKAEAMDGPNTATIGGKVYPNIEAGVRYMF